MYTCVCIYNYVSVHTVCACVWLNILSIIQKILFFPVLIKIFFKHNSNQTDFMGTTENSCCHVLHYIWSVFVWIFTVLEYLQLYICTYTGWPKKNGTVDTVDFSGLCSYQQLSFFTLLDRAFFPHYNNNTKIIKFGWENFFFMSNFLCTVIFGICPISRVLRHD